MKNKLGQVDKEVLECNKCGNLVEKFNNHTSVHYGKDKRILILGEAPANNGWRKSGKCWYGDDGKITASGRVMNKLLEPYDLTVDTVYFIEAIKCFPISRKSLKECSTNCESILIKQLEILKPEIIITLGDAATRSILKELKYKKFSDILGTVYQVNIGTSIYKVLPIYHPSPINPKGYRGNIDIMKTLKEYI